MAIITGIVQNHLCVDGVAVAVDSAILTPTAAQTVVLMAWQLERTVGDGYIELHFGARAQAKKIWRLGAAPAGVAQGIWQSRILPDGLNEIVGPLGLALNFSADGTGVVNGMVRAFVR